MRRGDTSLKRRLVNWMIRRVRLRHCSTNKRRSRFQACFPCETYYWNFSIFLEESYKKKTPPVDEEAAKGIMLNADGEYVQVMAYMGAACWYLIGFSCIELLLSSVIWLHN